ncbi:MAG: hypothetical protein ACJZ8R_07350 [Pseudohongiellaceae bacterium]|tara:strand:- start:624 stop:800 length:177 start_codon:yes stop_codon:yes gene_type:complete
MSKLARIVVEGTESERLQEAEFDSDSLYLKKQKEDEIRMKLDQFAKELSQVKKQRNKY